MLAQRRIWLPDLLPILAARKYTLVAFTWEIGLCTVSSIGRASDS
jgi:hypothetical protein